MARDRRRRRFESSQLPATARRARGASCTRRTATSRRRCSCRSAPGTVKALTAGEISSALGARDHPRQHLSPVPAAGPRASSRRRRPPPVHGLAARDPHRLGRLPGLLPARASLRSTTTASTFRSHIDGSPHRLTPERLDGRSRRALGSDIAMAFDQCPPGDAPRRGRRGRDRAHHRAGPQRCLRGPARRPGSCASASSRAAPHVDLRRAPPGRDRRAAASRLRARRPRGRRGARGDVRRARRDRRRDAGRSAALPDGRRHARGHLDRRSAPASTCSTA